MARRHSARPIGPTPLRLGSKLPSLRCPSPEGEGLAFPYVRFRSVPVIVVIWAAGADLEWGVGTIGWSQSVCARHLIDTSGSIHFFIANDLH